MSEFLKPTSSGVLILIHLQPRASENSIAGVHGGRLKIRLTAPPVDSKANDALREFLAAKLGVSVGAVRIVKGEKSRRKDVLVAELSVDQVDGRLSS
jgi:uncharacterized protein (TIGR00251 family)